MPRGKSSAAATTPATAKGHKRQLSGGTPATSTPGTRTSKRLKESVESTPASATPKKSKYFEGSDDDEDEATEPTSEGVEESGYEDEDTSTAEPDPTEDESEDDYDSEEENKKKGPGSKKKTGGIGSAIVGAGKQLWREGIKAGLGPGTQIFIEKPKPRGDGGIKYIPDRIHPHTMLFLADLKQNNDRLWLKSMLHLVQYLRHLSGTRLIDIQCTTLTTASRGKTGKASLMP